MSKMRAAQVTSPNGPFVGAIEKSGKKKIVLTGLWTETCVVAYAYTMVHGAPATRLPEYVVPAASASHQ